MIRALTLHQPWASLIANGAKLTETRSWAPPHRMTLAIHAGKTLDLEYAQEPEVAKALGPELIGPAHHAMPLGAFVCIVELAGWIRTEDLLDLPEVNPAWLKFGNFAPGRWAWYWNVLVRINEPIPARGMQKIWTPRREHALQLADRLNQTDARLAYEAAFKGGP